MKNKRIYNIWSCMKQRCNNPNHTAAFWYHDRGITVCDEWIHDFQAFYDWAMANGYRDDLTIDRKDPDGNYEPSNCRWVTIEENRKRAVKRRGSVSTYEYRLWKCHRFLPRRGEKICMEGIFADKKEAIKAQKEKIETLREISIKEANESKQGEFVLKNIKRKNSWLKYDYVIEKIKLPKQQ